MWKDNVKKLQQTLLLSLLLWQLRLKLPIFTSFQYIWVLKHPSTQVFGEYSNINLSN